MDILNVEIEVDALAKIVFLDNKNDAQIHLSLGGVENNKDLFYFCLDLFCKGLVLLFGSSNRVELEELTVEQFEVVRKKIANAGINVKLKVYEDIPGEDNEGEGAEGENTEAKSTLNISHLENLPNDLDLTEYTFVIRTLTLVYQVNFELFHNP